MREGIRRRSADRRVARARRTCPRVQGFPPHTSSWRSPRTAAPHAELAIARRSPRAGRRTTSRSPGSTPSDRPSRALSVAIWEASSGRDNGGIPTSASTSPTAPRPDTTCCASTIATVDRRGSRRSSTSVRSSTTRSPSSRRHSSPSFEGCSAMRTSTSRRCPRSPGASNAARTLRRLTTCGGRYYRAWYYGAPRAKTVARLERLDDRPAISRPRGASRPRCRIVRHGVCVGDLP